MNLRPVRQGTGCALVAIAYPLLGVVGVLLHLWTILIAYGVGGLIPAAISLAAPALSEIYWFFWIWHESGAFLNGYTVAVLVYAGLWLLTLIGAGMSDAT